MTGLIRTLLIVALIIILIVVFAITGIFETIF